MVAEDVRESGSRAILNFVLNFGHAIENSLGYGNWLHGEAVAAGMVMASELSGLGAGEQERLSELIDSAGLPTAPPPIASERWLESMGMDKKVQNKQLRFVLLRSLGDAYVSRDYDHGRLQAMLGAGD